MYGKQPCFHFFYALDGILPEFSNIIDLMEFVFSSFSLSTYIHLILCTSNIFSVTFVFVSCTLLPRIRNLFTAVCFHPMFSGCKPTPLGPCRRIGRGATQDFFSSPPPAVCVACPPAVYHVFMFILTADSFTTVFFFFAILRREWERPPMMFEGFGRRSADSPTHCCRKSER